MLLSAPIHQLKRRAKSLSRGAKIPLHEAQNRLARAEGFRTWSALCARMAAGAPRASLLANLVDGDRLLLGARPGQGKTMLGLQLLIDAGRDGRRAVFFTLDYTGRESMERIQSLDGRDHAPEIVTSEDISADFIVRHLAGSPKGTVAVIDYLQILDQQRTKPALADQVKTLSHFARDTGVILAFLSQIDRSFDAAPDALPGMADIRLPNAVPPGVFSKACFLHAGQMRLQEGVRHEA